MAANKITIKFNSQGERNLLKALKNLAKAQNALLKKTKEFGDEQENAGRKGRLLNNALATMRSKLLLASFAMTLLIKPLVRFAKEAAKVESMSMAFNTLSGGTVRASNAMDQLGNAVNGTMNKFDLFKQANNAMILGVTKNSDEMAKMFDMAQRLGRALGRDAASSVESLITGIGRQSRLMLDNIGIIVKADRAYKEYALSLGLAAEDLSESQRKQAFLNATMEAATQKVAGLPPEVLTAEESFQRFTATVDDLKIALGDSFKGVLSDAMNHFSDFVAINKDADFEALSYATNVNSLSFGLSQAKLELRKLTGGYVGFAMPSNAFNEEIERAQANVDMLSERLNKFQAPTPLDPALIFNFPFSPEDPDFDEQAFNNKLKRESELIVLMKEKKALEDNFISVLEQKGIMQEQLTQAQELKDAGIITENELIKLQISLKKKGISLDEKDAQAKIKNYSKIAGGLAGLNDAMKGSMKVTVRLQQIQAMIDAYAGAQSGWAQNKKAYPSPIPALLYAADIAVGLAQARALSTSIGDKFERGGLIGGRRHSAGGTIIEAEQGEFVMSRNAVDAVGVEAMNRINAGGGAGSVNISFAGNVMSQDFIEDEAIPMIKEAIRRGADIGVA